MPLGEIVPLDADQVTAVFEVLVTFAENCWLSPEARLAPLGETLMLTGEPELPAPLAMYKDRVASPRSCLGRSVTRTRKLKDPEVCGVPVTAPPLLSDNPCGKLPFTRENW